MRTREQVDLAAIFDNPWQPRQNIDADALRELAESIHQLGLLQTPRGRRVHRGRVELAFGHRRVAACMLLHQRGDWPATIEMDVDDDLTDEQMALMALTENERRQDVPDLDLLRAHRRAIDETDLTVGKLAEKLGVARPTLQNNLRVLTLPGIVLDRVESGDLKMGVAKELLVLKCGEQNHTDAMESVIQACEYSGRWTRKAVREWIHNICYSWRSWGLLEGDCPKTHRHDPSFDVAAFKAEHKIRLHRLPDCSNDQDYLLGSSLATCDVEAWDEWQTAADAEMRGLEGAEAPDDDDDVQDEINPRDKVHLESALADDPVWQGIASLRSEPDVDLPQNDREREALGTRSQFVDSYSQPFWKELRPADVHTPWDLQSAEREQGDGVPPWFPNLEECTSCVIGAKWTRHGYPAKTTLICTNREHYMEKLQAGEAAYRERLQQAREAEDAAAGEELESLLEDLMAAGPETLRMMLRAMVASNPVLDWRHPLGVYHERFSDEPQMVERIRMILGMEAVPYNQPDGRTIDPAAIEDLSHEDTEQLLAALTVHRLRKGWTATPEYLQESSPGNTPAESMSEMSVFLAAWNPVSAGAIIADLYVCWDCDNHHIPVEPGKNPPAFHNDCGGKLEWSGHLTGYDPDSGRIWRTWDEQPRILEV